VKKLIYLILAIMLINLVNAELTSDISIKDSFKLDEKVKFDYTVESTKEVMLSYFTIISCPEAPDKFIDQLTIRLEPGKKYSDTYSWLMIDETFERQVCTAILQIIKPEKKIIKKQFLINVEPALEIPDMLCNQEECDKNVFVRDESVFLDFDTGASDTESHVNVIFPDDYMQKVNLPAKVDLAQKGTYTLEVTATKTGHRDVTKMVELHVAEKPVIIELNETCNSDSICDKEENSKNCPQDCVSGTADGFCDQIRDNKCDPDCMFYQDIDCGQIKSIVSNTLYVIIISSVLILLIKLFRRKNEGSKVKKKRKKRKK